jgi:hypothetical protein
MADVKLVRLTTGEEILAKCENTATGVVVKDPMILVPLGQGKLGFAKWLPYANTESGVAISSNYVMFVLDPDSEMKNQYISASSGIVLPPAGSGPQLKITGAP